MFHAVEKTNRAYAAIFAPPLARRVLAERAVDHPLCGASGSDGERSHAVLRIRGI